MPVNSLGYATLSASSGRHFRFYGLCLSAAKGKGMYKVHFDLLPKGDTEVVLARNDINVFPKGTEEPAYDPTCNDMKAVIKECMSSTKKAVKLKCEQVSINAFDSEAEADIPCDPDPSKVDYNSITSKSLLSKVEDPDCLASFRHEHALSVMRTIAAHCEFMENKTILG